MAFSPHKQANKLEKPVNEEEPIPKVKEGKKFCVSHKCALRSILLIKCGNPHCVANNIQRKIKENNHAGYLIYYDGYKVTNSTENISKFNAQPKKITSAQSAKINAEKSDKVKHNNSGNEEIDFEKELDQFEKFLNKDLHNENFINDTKCASDPKVSPIKNKEKQVHQKMASSKINISNIQSQEATVNAQDSVKVAESKKQIPAFESFDKEYEQMKPILAPYQNDKQSKENIGDSCKEMAATENFKTTPNSNANNQSSNQNITASTIAVAASNEGITEAIDKNDSNDQTLNGIIKTSAHANEEKSIDCYITFIDVEAIDDSIPDESNVMETYALDATEHNVPKFETERLANVHSTNTKLLESNLANLKYLCEINKDILFLLDQIGSEDKLPEIGKAKLRLTQIEDKINKDKDHLKEISILSNAFKQTLEMPEFGNVDEFDMEEAALSCNTFTDADGKITLDQFWKKICNYAKLKNLTEKATKNLLGSLLHGHGFEIYNDNKEKDLETITQVLIDRFGEITTISDHVRALENLTRGPKEKLASVMSRCALLLDKTKYLAEAKHRDSRYEIEMKNKLFTVCSQKAKMAIERERNYALRAGYSLPYANLFNLALDAEREEIRDSTYLY